MATQPSQSKSLSLLANNMMDEQTEATIVAQLKKLQNFNGRSPIFNARKELREAMIEYGMPEKVANVVVGRMMVQIHEEHKSGAIYDQLLDATAKNITELYKLYVSELSEETFLECSRGYMFCPPIITREAPPEGENESKP
jgi:hypothetical protein